MSEKFSSGTQTPKQTSQGYFTHKKTNASEILAMLGSDGHWACSEGSLSWYGKRLDRTGPFSQLLIMTT